MGKLAKVARSQDENLGFLTPGPLFEGHKPCVLLAQYNSSTEGAQTPSMEGSLLGRGR